MTSLDTSIEGFVSDASCVVTQRSSLRDVADALGSSAETLALVVHEGAVVGVVSEGDIVHAIHDGADLDEVWAADVMTTELVAVSTKASLRDAITTMLDAGTHQVLVLDSDVVPGLVSLSDAVSAVTDTRLWNTLP